jgi:hypothetical protein
MNVDLIVALVTLAGTLVVLIWNIIDRRQSEFDARMSQATELLTGKTQRRSAGIAIIEGAKDRLRRRGMWRTERILLLLIDLAHGSALEAKVAGIGRWIKEDRGSAEPRTTGLDRGEIEKMVDGSSRISSWAEQGW